MSTDNLLGTVIDGRYEVLSRIARGGMATVYRAHDRRLERDVAVKIMHPHLAESEAFITRFRREARAAAGLGHPNAVAIFDQGMWGDSFYLTMEYIDGEDLRDVLRREGAVPVGEALSICADILDALGSAHRRGLIHRDIKPENVLISADGTPKLADFGLARAASDATAASTGTVLGTVAYLAPELVTHGVATAASDVYAVGVMLYEMITGRQPFAGDIPINIAFQHVMSSVPAASDHVPELPREVDDLIAALSARDPSERIPDGDSARTAVRRVSSDLSQESAGLRAAVAGTAVSGESETADEIGNGPDGTAPIWVRPSSGTAAIPVGAAQPGALPPTATRRSRLRPLLISLVLVFLAVGGVLTYYFTLGPGAHTTVPRVASMESDAATWLIESRDLVADTRTEFSDTIPAGIVISTEPADGESVRKNSTVEVVVSQGIEKHEVPDVVGQPQDEAIASLDRFSTPEVVEAYDQEIPTGSVVSLIVAADGVGPDGEVVTAGDDPEPGTLLPHNTVFELTISLGRQPVDAPDVTEETFDDAVAVLSEAGLTGVEAEERVYHDTVPEGSVVSQNVTGAGPLRGDTITLTVSKGPDLVEVPRVVWMSQSEAEAALRAAGLEVNVESPIGVILNTVQSQSVRAGTWVKRGTEITIRVV